MRHQTITSARQVLGELHASERGCDEALASNARLVATMLEARGAAGLSASTGRSALGCVVSAVAYAAKAREMVLDAHHELAQLNIRELAAGDLSKCPEKWAMAPLTVVDSESQAA